MTDEPKANGSVSIREVYSLVEQMRRDLVEAMEATRARHHQSMNDITVQLAKLSIRIEDLSKTTGELEHSMGLKADAVSVQNLSTLASSMDTRLRSIENGEQYRQEITRRFINLEGVVQRVEDTVVSSSAVNAYKKWIYGAFGAVALTIGFDVFLLVVHK